MLHHHHCPLLLSRPWQILYTRLKTSLALANTILARVLHKVFKSYLKKILRNQNELTRCEYTSIQPPQGTCCTPQIYSFSGILTSFKEPLCERMGWAASQYGGWVCHIFFGPSYRGVRGSLLQKSYNLCLSEFTFLCSVSRLFPSPFQARKLPDWLD